jgi:hypothetical protein
MRKTATPPRKPESFKYYGTKDNPYILGGLSKDYWRGRKDGKKAPTACESALGAVEAAEMRYREETRNGLRQAQEEAKAVIAFYDDQINANAVKMGAMETARTLVPEPVANAEYRAALKDSVIASLLMVLEIIGLAEIGKGMFGQGFISALIIAFLISLTSALLVKYFLSNTPDVGKKTVKRILSAAGFIFLATGLVGFVILRSETFTGGLTGGSFNFDHIWWGNLLLIIGITLGVPCVAGALYEDASEKLKLSKSSKDLYSERQNLTVSRNAWDVQLKKLEEFDKQLNGITDQEISFRKNRYVRGFHIGSRRNTEAVQEIRRVTATGNTSNK